MTNNRKSYNENFKREIVELFKSGQKVIDISKNYKIAESTIYKWIAWESKTGSFKTNDQLTEDQRIIKELKKENKRLKEELDILKQAALILAKDQNLR